MFCTGRGNTAAGGVAASLLALAQLIEMKGKVDIFMCSLGGDGQPKPFGSGC